MKSNMKGNILNIISIIILIIVQYFIAKEVGANLIGYGFYINAVILFLLFCIEFILISLMLAFYAEHFFRKDGIIDLIRFRSREKTYLLVVKNTIIKIIAIKLLCYFTYSIFISALYKEINSHDIVLAFVFNLTVSIILYVLQIKLEIRYGAKLSLLVTNSLYIMLTVLGSILNELEIINTGLLSKICNLLNKLLITNYLYLERIKSLNIRYFPLFLILLVILTLFIFIGKPIRKKLDITEEKN